MSAENDWEVLFISWFAGPIGRNFSLFDATSNKIVENQSYKSLNTSFSFG